MLVKWLRIEDSSPRSMREAATVRETLLVAWLTSLPVFLMVNLHFAMFFFEVLNRSISGVRLKIIHQ